MTSEKDSVQRYVYFAKAGDMMKIGCSVKPLQRLVSISEWIPFKVEIVATIVGGYSLESSFHAYFEEEWSHMEWFRISPRMEVMVADILAGKEISLPAPASLQRKSEIVKLKNAATRRITKIEKVSGRAPRPKYLSDAIAAYAGPNTPPPDDSVLAAISRYECEIKQARRLERLTLWKLNHE